jgi:hypothetical protein
VVTVAAVATFFGSYSGSSGKVIRADERDVLVTGAKTTSVVVIKGGKTGASTRLLDRRFT